MGNKHTTEDLSGRVKDLATEIFREIDVDNSGTIDMEETARWWQNNFAKINTKAMFEIVDRDHNGTIEFDEWMNFWTTVKAKGHSEEEIEEELENIRCKGSWVQFVGCPSTHASKKD